MNYKKKIIAVIVTYNRINILKECIDSLLKSSIKCDILVVNNNSIDGTDEFLEKFKNSHYDNTYIFNLKENLNGAGGFNYGIKKAIELNYDYLWIMDDDCIVKENTLEELLKVDNELNGNYGFLSSKVLWIDGTICKTNVQRRRVAYKVKNFTSHIYKVDYCSFVSCFVKAENIKNIGLPIKEFIIWSDDLEWTRRLTNKRINKKAKNGYLCNDSIVIHKCANNNGISIINDNEDRIYRYNYIYRNDVVCFRNEGLLGHIYLFIRNCYHIFKIIICKNNNKLKKIKTILKGYIDGYKFKPGIEYIN